MCLEYSGREYHYGIIVDFQQGSSQRRFNILMTNHKEDLPYKYGGLCLDNNLYVSSDEREKHAALCDIINKVLNGSLVDVEEDTQRCPNQTYQPLINITEEEPKLYKIFLKRMKGARSFEEYSNIQHHLTPLREKREVDTFLRKFFAICVFIRILPHCVPIIYDCKDIHLAFNKLKEEPRLKNAQIKYRMV
jgi:hypothetical protein